MGVPPPQETRQNRNMESIRCVFKNQKSCSEKKILSNNKAKEHNHQVQNEISFKQQLERKEEKKQFFFFFTRTTKRLQTSARWNRATSSQSSSSCRKMQHTCSFVLHPPPNRRLNVYLLAVSVATSRRHPEASRFIFLCRNSAQVAMSCWFDNNKTVRMRDTLSLS